MPNPKLITTSFAETGSRNDIPESGASEPQLATMQSGWPVITSTPITGGGIPPEREDFNGMFHLTTSHLRFLNNGMWYEFDPVHAGQIGGYSKNSRVMLTTGEIAQSTVDGNVNDPNSNPTGWIIGTPASAVKDSSGLSQQYINNGVPSISALRLLSPKASGERVYLLSWHEGLALGGGDFVTTNKAGLVDNGGTIIASATAGLFYVRINYDRITPLMFGAKGDTVYDDRPAFQAAINLLWSNRGGELYVPTPLVEYRWKSYDAAESTCLHIPESKRGPYVDPIVIRGEGKLNMIKVDLSVSAPSGIKSAVKLGGFGHYRTIENLSIWGGVSSTVPYVDYVIHGADNYSPNITLENLQIYVAKINCLRLATYVSNLTQVTTAYSPRGFYIDKPEGSGSAPCTSITFQNCYALNHTEYGFWCGELTYSTFLNCAADHIISPNGSVEAYPYYIDIARGITFEGCGAESSSRILRVRAAQGLIINGIMTLSIGLVASGQAAPNHLIRIDGGWSSTISGIYLHNSLPFTYKLSVGATFGRETVVVIDESIAPAEATFVPNSSREKPILFLSYQKSKVTRNLPMVNSGNATTNSDKFKEWASYSYDLELVHTLTIQLPSGDFPINSAVFLTNAGTSGYARVRLLGNADGTSRIVCTGAGSVSFGLPSSLARMSYTIENVTIHADSTITAGTRPALFYNADVYFINSKLTSHNGAVQYGTTATSKLILDVNSAISTPAVSSGIVEYSYKATSAPASSSRLPVGTRFEASDPNATRIGWINTVDNGATWLALTP